MNTKPDILLVGTGAVGSYYAGRLHQAGARVSVLCRSDYDIVKKKGIAVQSVAGDFDFKPAEVLKTIDEYSRVPDFMIIATKVLPEINIPSLIGSKVGRETVIVLLQNGIDIEEPVAKAFPDNVLISAIAFISVSRPEYGLIDHKDYGRLIIGIYPSGASDHASLLASLFKQAGVRCDIDQDIITARWRKLMWNAPFNPLSVLCSGADTREMMESEPLVTIAVEIMKELMILAACTGHPVSASVIDSIISDTRSMAPTRTSMLQDYESRRPLEVEAILGNTVRIARRHEVSIPHLSTLYALLTIVDRKNRAV
jgi:2-dehydropantoate 2-reductase